MKITAKPDTIALRDLIQRSRKKTVIDPSKKPTWLEFAAKTLIRSGRAEVPFIPYDWQIQLEEQLKTHFGCVLVKTRQLGATEYIASRLLHNAFNDPGYVAVVFSKTQDDSSDIAKRVRLMGLSHPDIHLESENVKDLKLVNGGRLIFKPSTAYAARGIPSVSEIVFDECAFVPDIDAIYSAALPSTEMLGSEARIILMSTPNGQQGFFWERLNEENGDRNVLEMCRQIRTGETDPIQHWTDAGGWCKFFVHWKAHPIYCNRPNYLEEIKRQKKLTDRQLQQEYNLGFDESLNQVYKPELVKAAETGQWMPPIPRRKYLAAVDPSFGGEDFYTLQIWDVTSTPYQLVREYREHLKSKAYNLEKTVELLNQYRPAVVGVEGNGGGSLIAQELDQLLRTTPVETITTTNTNKITNTDRIALLLERGWVAFPPGCSLASELLNFRETLSGTRRTREAATGHDDGVMAMAIAFSLLGQVSGGDVVVTTARF